MKWVKTKDGSYFHASFIRKIFINVFPTSWHVCIQLESYSERDRDVQIVEIFDSLSKAEKFLRALVVDLDD